MKRFIWLLLAVVLTTSPAFGAAQNISFLLSQVRTSAGGALVGGKVYFYSAGTTTAKSVWLDKDKQTLAANPYTLDANATAQIYGDGTYRVVIKDSTGVTRVDRDNLNFADLQKSIGWISDEEYSSLALADAAAVAAGKQLIISTQWDTVPSTLNAAIRILPGGQINNSGPLVIKGSFECGPYQVFFGAGSVSGLKRVMVEWFGAKFDGVTNDTVAMRAALTAGAGGTIEMPSGTGIVDTLSPTNGTRLIGRGNWGSGQDYVTQGAGATVLKAISNSTNVIERDGGGTSYITQLEIANLVIVGSSGPLSYSGTGHGIYLHGSIYGGSEGIYIHDVTVAGMGGKGIYLPTSWHTNLERVTVDLCGDNLFELQGGNTTTLTRCYAQTVASNKVGFRIYGNATLIACNGVNSNNSGMIWGMFGLSTASGDASNLSASIVMIGCNVESATYRGLWLKYNSTVSLHNVTFLAPVTNGAVAMHFETSHAGYLSTIDTATTFGTTGGTWLNDCAVHCATSVIPFQTTANTGFSLWNDAAGTTRAIPYFGVTGDNGDISVSSIRIGTLGQSDRLYQTNWGSVSWTPGTIANGSVVSKQVGGVIHVPVTPPSYGHLVVVPSVDYPLPPGVFLHGAVDGSTTGLITVSLLNMSGSTLNLGTTNVNVLVFWVY